jgi:hypothetical protein
MYRKRNRLYARLEADRLSDAADPGTWDFVTTTLSPSLVTEENAYKWIKPAMAYAIQKVRQPRRGLDHKSARRGTHGGSRWRRAAWPGVSLEYMNDVDVQPGTRMPHVHALYLVKRIGAYLPSKDAIARELHYYFNSFIYRKLGREPKRWEIGRKYPYGRRASVGYVHFSPARSTENCAMYMALHNGKIWTDGREYPPRYRRFATSRGFLPAVPKKEPSGWVFVRNSLGAVVKKLALQGVHPTGENVQRGHDGFPLAVELPAALGSAYVQWAIGTAPADPDRRPGLALHDPACGPELVTGAAERMQQLQAYWAEDADLQGVTFEAWQRGECGLYEPSLCPGGDDPFWEPDFELLSEYSRRWPRCSVADLRHNLRALYR